MQTNKLKTYGPKARRDRQTPGVTSMFELRVVKIGASLAVQLPLELINRLHLADGDYMILPMVT